MAVMRVIPAGDLDLQQGSLFVLDGSSYTRQKLSVRFKFFITEWFLDQRQGVPYYRDVLGKTPNLDVVRSLFRKIILGTPGVLSLSSFKISIDEAQRTLAFAFQANAKDGPITVVETDADFILDLTQ